MSGTDTAVGEAPSPRPSTTRKRKAILDAARAVFARTGYLGASIEVIAGEAAVSTRTIYNHFANKEHLFTTVLTESSHEVAAAREATIDRHLGDVGGVVDLEAALVAFGCEWLRTPPRFAEHFAIVRRITAEADNLPAELYEGWQEAGPRRVQRVLAERLAGLGERGLLHVKDPVFAAQHLSLLVTANLSGRARLGADPVGRAEAERIAAAGVRAFLHGYLPPALSSGRARPPAPTSGAAQRRRPGRTG